MANASQAQASQALAKATLGFSWGCASLVAGGWGLGGDMLVGACAQLTGGLLFTPVDVVKERMQVRA